MIQERGIIKMSNRKSLTSVLLAAVMAMGPAVPAWASIEEYTCRLDCRRI